MYCPECGTDAAEANFCPQCGNDLTALSGGATKAGVCPECGTDAGKAKFCPECGHQMPKPRRQAGGQGRARAASVRALRGGRLRARKRRRRSSRRRPSPSSGVRFAVAAASSS